MARATKIDMFGIDHARLLSVLKRLQTPTIVSSQEAEHAPILIKTGYFLFRAQKTDELGARYPLSEVPYDLTNIREGWQRFEEMPATPLRLTNVLVEIVEGTLARKFVTHDGSHAVYVAKQYLDVFGLDHETLQTFLFASAHQPDGEVHLSPIRISLKERYTCGYVMCMVNIVER